MYNLFYFPILPSPSRWNSQYFQYWEEKYYVGKWLQGGSTVNGRTSIFWIPHELGKFNGFISSAPYSPSCYHQKCFLNWRRETICRKAAVIRLHTVGRVEHLHWTLSLNMDMPKRGGVADNVDKVILFIFGTFWCFFCPFYYIFSGT